MSSQDLHKLSTSDLQKKLAEERGELHHLKFQAANAQLNNVRAIRATRKRVAQILSALNASIKEANQSE
jgi:ribosomal protein L29